MNFFLHMENAPLFAHVVSRNCWTLRLYRRERREVPLGCLIRMNNVSLPVVCCDVSKKCWIAGGFLSSIFRTTAKPSHAYWCRGCLFANKLLKLKARKVKISTKPTRRFATAIDSIDVGTKYFFNIVSWLDNVACSDETSASSFLVNVDCGN